MTGPDILVVAAGVSDWAQYVLYGATLVVAVAVSSVIGRQRGRGSRSG